MGASSCSVERREPGKPASPGPFWRTLRPLASGSCRPPATRATPVRSPPSVSSSKPHLRACEQLPATERARAFLQVRKLAGDLASLLKLLSPHVARVFHDAPTVSTSENAEQAFSEGLAEFLGKLVKAAGPTIIFVDDVQWLDPSSRRVLVRAANQTATRRVLFVFGARDGEVSADVNRLLDILSAPVSAVELLPLAAEDVLDVVRDYLAVEEVDPGAQGRRASTVRRESTLHLGSAAHPHG